MATATAAVDVEHLRRTLSELGYHELLVPEAAPLVHHILTDMKQATLQYTELLHHYDDLYARWQQESANRTVLDTSQLSALDSSMFESHNVDESFMLQAVEQARARIETLAASVQSLQSEKETLTAELRKSQTTAHEISQHLHAKHAQVDALQAELHAMATKQDLGASQQLLIAAKTAISLLPIELQSSFTAKLSDSAETQLSTLNEVLIRLRKEMASQATALQEAWSQAERLKREYDGTEQAMAKMKAGVAQYQTQIADLNARLHQRDFEKSLQSDITMQISALEGINDMIKEKVAVLDRLKLETTQEGPGEMAQMTVQALLESLSAELSTEVCFTSHLNQLVEKLNKRRVEQDRDLAACFEKLGNAETKLAKQEGEKIDMSNRLDRALRELAHKDGSFSTNNEVVANLKQALELKQAKIEEQKTYCAEIKSALDQCQISMANMRRNEEMIRKHVTSQDFDISMLRKQTEQLALEKGKLSGSVQELENELVGLKNVLKDKSVENERLSSELRASLNAQEKQLVELRTAKESISELEDAVVSKRREKDLLMTTYCRVIKDNEKLHADLQKIQEDLVASRTGDSQSEAAFKAFQTKSQLQAQEIERLKTHIVTAETKIQELETQLRDAVQCKRQVEEESSERKREITTLKGLVSSLERNKKDLAAQMARFGKQASELRNHLRRIEEERNGLQVKLKGAAAMDNPAAKTLQHQLASVTMELEQVKMQLHLLERERDGLSQQLRMEKTKYEKMEQAMMQERNKRLEKEVVVQSLETARSKLKDQMSMLSKEHERSLQAVRRQIQSIRDENERLKNWEALDSDPIMHGRYGQTTKSAGSNDGGDGENDETAETPSPPESPKDAYVLKKTDATERLKAQNRALRRHLLDIRKEMRETLSPGNSVADELESSLTALTSEDSGGGSVSPTSDELASSNAEMQRRLEQENRILFKIVDKVKSELMRAGMETPGSISSSLAVNEQVL